MARDAACEQNLPGGEMLFQYGQPSAGAELLDGGVSDLSKPKSSVHVAPPEAAPIAEGISPVRTSLKEGSRMFWQCWGLAIQLFTTACGVP